MAALVLPQRKMVQPQYSTGIAKEWAARGFNWAVIGGMGVELVSGTPFVTTTGGTLSTNSNGNTFETHVGASVFLSTPPSVPTTEVTLVWLGTLATPGNQTNSQLAGFPHNLADSYPYVVGAMLGGTRSGFPGSPFTLYAADSGANFYALTSTATVSANTPLCVVATVKNGEQKLYINGVLTDSWTNVLGTFGVPSVNYFAIGNAFTVRNADCSTNLHAASNIAISAPEAVALSINPWQLFNPRLT